MSKAKVVFTSFALGLFILLLPCQSWADTYYTVKSGDSLWEISQAYNTTVDKIQSLNNLGSVSIYPDQKLLVISDTGDNSNSVQNNINTTQSGSGSVQNSNNLVNDAQANQGSQVSRDSDRIGQILDYANSLIGVPYVPSGTSPSGFDCSGYTQYVFAKFGINLPRTADEQYHEGQAISASEAMPGDLVAFQTGSSISHVGIYVGNGNFISATSSHGVDIAPVYGDYWGDHFLGFSRIIPQ